MKQMPHAAMLHCPECRKIPSRFVLLPPHDDKILFQCSFITSENSKCQKMHSVWKLIITCTYVKKKQK